MWEGEWGNGREIWPRGSFMVHIKGRKWSEMCTYSLHSYIIREAFQRQTIYGAASASAIFRYRKWEVSRDTGLSVFVFFRLGYLLNGSWQSDGESSGVWLVITRATATAHEPNETQTFHLHPRIHCCEPRESGRQRSHWDHGRAGNETSQSVYLQSWSIIQLLILILVSSISLLVFSRSVDLQANDVMMFGNQE